MYRMEEFSKQFRYYLSAMQHVCGLGLFLTAQKIQPCPEDQNGSVTQKLTLPRNEQQIKKGLSWIVKKQRQKNSPF